MLLLFYHTHAQTTLHWKMLPSDANPAIKHPRHLYLIGDTALFLGSRHYLSKVDTSGVYPIYYSSNDQSVIRSIVQHNDTLFFSVENNGVYFISKEDYTDIHSTPFSRKEIHYWAMCTYKHQLVVTGWPRNIAFYDSLQYSWEYSFDLIQNAKGVIFQIEQHEEYLYATLYEGGVFRYKDEKWEAINKGLPSNLRVRGILTHNKFQYVATEEGIYYRPLKKTTWTKVNGSFGDAKLVELIGLENYIFATGCNGELFMSNNDGKSWKSVHIQNSEGYVVYGAAIMHDKLFLSAESTNEKPSGVFTIPLSELKNYITE